MELRPSIITTILGVSQMGRFDANLWASQSIAASWFPTIMALLYKRTP
jgi:hypothetical protein